MGAPSTAIYEQLIRNIQALDSTADVVGTVERFAVYGYTRAPVVDVAAALETAKAATGDGISPLSVFHVYADVAWASGPIKIPASCKIVKIFARQAFPGNAPQSPLRINIDGSPTAFVVYTSVPASNLAIGLIRGNLVESVNLSFSQGSGNAMFKAVTGTPPEVNGSVPPPEENFNYMSVSDLILDNGQILQTGLDRMNDNLPKLLTFQMLLAESLQQTQPGVSYQLASFVAGITVKIAKALDWNSQATNFLGAQVIGDAANPQRYVPDINLSVAKSVLTSRLSAAQAFEVAYQNFKTLGIQVQNTQTMANAALDAAEATVRAYTFLADEAKLRYDNALNTLVTATKRFQDLETNLPDAQKKFQDGIEAFKQKQIALAIVKGLAMLIVVTGTVAVACVAPPAGTAVVAESGAILPIIEVAEGAPKTVSTLAEIFIKLRPLLERMEPSLDKIDKVIDQVQETMTLLVELKITGKAEGVGDMPAPPFGQDDDEINMSAQWDVFDVQISATFSTIEEYKIEGADEYLILMKQMVILAKAVLSAQLAVSAAGANYTTALTQSLLSQQQASAMRKAVANLQGNPYAISIFQRSMFDQLLNIRSWVFMDMMSYTSAYAWFALDDLPPITLDPAKAVASLMGDAATIEAKAAQAATVLRPQRRTFIFRTSEPADPLVLIGNAGDWIAGLRQSRTAQVTISPNHAIFDPYMRIRVVSMLVIVEGANVGPGGSSVGLTITRSQTMADLRRTGSSTWPLSSSLSSSSSPPPALSPSPSPPPPNAARIVAFVGQTHKLGVNYVPDDQGMTAQRVLMSGTLAPGFYTAGESSSLFADWTLLVDNEADLSSVSGLSMEVECEVSLV